MKIDRTSADIKDPLPLPAKNINTGNCNKTDDKWEQVPNETYSKLYSGLVFMQYINKYIVTY